MKNIEKIIGMKQVLDFGMGVEEVFTGDQAKINEIIERINELSEWFNTENKTECGDEDMVGDDVMWDK